MMENYEDLFIIPLIMVVIGLLTYSLWNWLYRKFISDKRKRQIATWVSTIVITPLIYIGAIYLLLFWMFYYPKQTFEKQAWETQPGKRYEMSADIIQSHILIGKTKAQVQDLLGKPLYFGKSDKWYYYLGFLPGVAMDADQLYIEFKYDKAVKVSQIVG